LAVAVAPAEVGFSAAEVGLIFGFLFLWAAVQILETIHPPISNLAGAVPLVGNGLRSAVDGAFSFAQGWLYSNLSASLAAYSDLLSWLQTLWAAVWGVTGGLAELTVAAVYRITTVIIPAEISLATAAAGALAASAEQQAQGFAVGVESRSAAALGAAQAGLMAMVGSARAEALGLFNAAEADLSAGVARAEAVAVDLAAQERAFALAAVAGVESDLNARVSQVQALTAAAEAALRGDLGTVAGDLARNLEAGVSALEQEIAKARTLIATGAGSIALVAADVAAIRAMRCLQSCNVLGAAGEGLQLLDLASLLALIAAAKSDPVAVQSFFVTEVAPAVRSISQAI
jgi:hypothetical protein